MKKEITLPTLPSRQPDTLSLGERAEVASIVTEALALAIEMVEYIQSQRHLVELAHEQSQDENQSADVRLKKTEVLLESYLCNTDEPIVYMLGTLKEVLDKTEDPLADAGNHDVQPLRAA